MTEPYDPDDLERFAARVIEVTALHGPQQAQDLWRVAGVPWIDGAMMLIDLSRAGRIVGDGFDGTMRWRGRTDADTDLVCRGHIWMTPATAVVVDADRDQTDAELRDATDEQWVEIEAEMGRLERSFPGIWAAMGDEVSRIRAFKPGPTG